MSSDRYPHVETVWDAPAIRVLRVMPTLEPTFGGPVSALASSVAEMAARGVVTDIAVSDSPHQQRIIEWEARSARVMSFGPPRTRWRYAPGIFRWLEANVASYDLIIVHGIWPYGSFATWRACRKAGAKYVAFVHGSLDPWYRRGQPLKYLSKWGTWPWAQYRILRDAERTLFTSQKEMELASRSFWPYRCRPLVVRYGIDPPPAQSSPPHQTLDSDSPLLYLGRVHPKKGLDLLIRAVSDVANTYPELHVVIAGGGDEAYEQHLRRLAKQVGVEDRVHWHGHVEGGTKWDLLGSSRALILPSHTENFGVVVAEALACGIPTLVTNKVNIAEVIQAERSGLVGDDTLEGVTGMLRHFLEMTAAEVDEMRRNTRPTFEKYFSISGAVDDLLDLIDCENT